jgi:Flp pilus assembly protein TadD
MEEFMAHCNLRGFSCQRGSYRLKNLKSILPHVFVAFGSFLFVACRATNSSDHIVVNASKSDALIYSTSDERTALLHGERLEDLKGLRDRLKEHLKPNRSDLEAMFTLAQVRQMLRKDLKNSNARKVLGQIALKRGQGDLALIYFSNLGGVNSKDASVINMIAQIELQKGNSSTAMALFKKAIRLDPNDHAARMNLGVLYIKHRQMSLASVEFERILQTEPHHLDAQIHMAIVMISRQEFEQAKDLLENVLDVDQDNPLALYNLSVAYKLQKDYESALDYLKKYVDSKRGTASDHQQAYALMNKIQKSQATEGQEVSDDEIEKIASDLKKNEQSPKKPKPVKTKVAAKAAVVKEDNAKKQTKENLSTSDGEEIEDLERTLK